MYRKNRGFRKIKTTMHPITRSGIECRDCIKFEVGRNCKTKTLKMKHRILLIFLILLIVGCNSSKRFYNSGYVNSKNDIEEIDIYIVND